MTLRLIFGVTINNTKNEIMRHHTRNQNLSNREQEVLELIAYEHTINEIAVELFISRHTVISHRKNILIKMDARNTAGMIRRAFELNFLNFSSPQTS